MRLVTGGLQGSTAPQTGRPGGPAAPHTHRGCHHCLKPLARGGRPWQRGAAPACCAAAGDDAAPDPLPGSSVPDTLPVAPADGDWREFRARLVASAGAAADAADAGPRANATWAHSLPQPEHGCLLLANPLMFGASQTYFHMAVILVWAHDSRGSAGLILNRPTEYAVSHFGAGAGFLAPEFGAATLHLGGDVGADTVHLLHGVGGLPACNEVVPGVFLGGFDAAKRGVAEGRLSVEQFKILTRYAGWGAGQLESECARGVWLPVSASADVVLGGGGREGADMWHFVAQLAGGDLSALSREVLGVAEPGPPRATGGGYGPKEEQECEGGGGGDAAQHAARASWRQQQRRRGRLPEADNRDGAGI